jgi:hypothetical protein
MSIPASSKALYICASQVQLFSGYNDGIFALLLQTLFRNLFRLATSLPISAKKLLRAFRLSCCFLCFASLFDNGTSFWKPVNVSAKLLFASKSFAHPFVFFVVVVVCSPPWLNLTTFHGKCWTNQTMHYIHHYDLWLIDAYVTQSFIPFFIIEYFIGSAWFNNIISSSRWW